MFFRVCNGILLAALIFNFILFKVTENELSDDKLSNALVIDTVLYVGVILGLMLFINSFKNNKN